RPARSGHAELSDVPRPAQHGRGGTPSRGGLHTLRTSQPPPLAGTTRGDHHTWRSTRRGFRRRSVRSTGGRARRFFARGSALILLDRKSTRLNSSHVSISYAAFCLKKKTKN